MPPEPHPTGRRLGRRDRRRPLRRNGLAPYVPLAIGLVSYAPLPTVSLPGPTGSAAVATCDDSIADTLDCHKRYPTGCSLSQHPAYDAFLNTLKNRTDVAAQGPPSPLTVQDFDHLNQNTPADLNSRNHGQFASQLQQLGETREQTVVAYLYYAKKSGAESPNCSLSETDEEVDYHIGIGFDATLAKRAHDALQQSPAALKKIQGELEQASIVVEMTPHYRAQFHKGWSLEALQQSIGSEVRVVGQLLMDNDHNKASDVCGRPDAVRSSCWRYSAWELHPVTAFDVCKAGGCTISSGDWVDLSTVQ